MMRLVVDASVAVKWLVEEEHSAAADMLLEGDHELHAPHLMASEIGNALWRKARVGEMEPSEVASLTASIPAMSVNWEQDEAICSEAVRLALDLDRPVYDCVYLALAHRIGATLVTADERFVNALTGTVHEGAVTTLTALALE